MINNQDIYYKGQTRKQFYRTLTINTEWVKSIGCMLLVLFTVYTTDTAYFTANISSKIILLITGLIASFSAYIWFNLKRSYLLVSKYKLMFLFFFTSMAIATMIYNSDNIRSYYHIFLLLFCGFFISELMSFQVFTRMFKALMYFLCIASLIAFVLKPIIIQYLFMFPHFSNESEIEFINFWVTVVSLTGANRNLGVFWEPGAFQAYINLALILELFYNKRLPRTSYLLTFILTVLTTFSTTGLICLCLIITAYGIKTKFLYAKDFRIMAIIVLLITGLFVHVQLNPDLYFAEGVNSEFGKLSEAGGSLDERLNASISSLYVSMHNPFLGVGINNNMEIAGQMGSSLDRSFKFHANTVAYWLASYGLILGLVLCFLYIKLCFIICREKVIRVYVLFIIGAVFLVLATENYLNSTFFNTLIFYSLAPDNRGLLQK